MNKILIHGLPARCWKKNVDKSHTRKEKEALIQHRTAAIRYLADQLAEQLSDVDKEVSARNVLDSVRKYWPQDCLDRLRIGCD